MRKARNGYQLQRGVPKDVQPVIGKTIWVEGAGSTYRVAQRLSPAFAAKTDRLIAEARNEVSLTGNELIDLVPQRFDLSNSEIVDHFYNQQLNLKNDLKSTKIINKEENKVINIKTK